MAFDTHYGWPYDGAIVDNAAPKEGEGIVEGMAIKQDANGLLVKADGTEAENAGFCLRNQDALDVQFAESMPYIVKNALCWTDQYMAGVYAIDDVLQVDTGANAGKLKKHAGGSAPVFGIYKGTEARRGITMIKVQI